MVRETWDFTVTVGDHNEHVVFTCSGYSWEDCYSAALARARTKGPVVEAHIVPEEY